MAELLSSAQNPKIKALRKLLSSKNARRESGTFVLEGARLCEEALYSRTEVLELYVTDDAADRYPDTVEALETAAGRVYRITEALSELIGDSVSPQGIFCVVRRLDKAGDLCTMKGTERLLLADHLQDPGNLGTIIRTAEALGADGLILCVCPEIESPKVLRASMGGALRLPIWEVDDLTDAIRLIQNKGMKVYAAALRDDAIPLTDIRFGDGTAVVIGNEGNGLGQEVIDCCDASVIIPMRPDAESLNASAAASILLWELCK